MTRIDQIITDALAGSPETHVAILAREVVRLREARAVVMPELTRRQSTDIANEAQMITGRSIWPSTVEAIAKIMRSRAIPADRVLEEGMAEGLRLLRDALVELCDSQLSSRDREGAIARGLAALRANQGGANHD